MSSKLILTTYRSNPAFAALQAQEEEIGQELKTLLETVATEATIKINALHKRHVDICEQGLQVAIDQKLLPEGTDPRQVSISFGPADDGAYWRKLKAPHSLAETYNAVDSDKYILIKEPTGIAGELMKHLL